MLRIPSAFLFAVAVILLSVSLIAHAQSQFLLTRHTRDAVVNGQAQFLGRLPAARTMRFDIVLALRHPVELDNFLEQLYDPTNPSYRRFVTVKEFTGRFGPSQDDYNALIQFARASGFRVTGGSRDAMDAQLEGTVAAIEKAFHVRMGVYQHPTEPRTFYAPDREPTVELTFQLWHITGLDNYSIPRPLLMHRNFKTQPEAQTGSCPGQSFCGSDMRAAYYEGTDLTGAGQNIGLLEFAGFNIADVNTYYQNAGQTRTFAVTGISTDGSPISCVYPSCDDSEQTVDITQAGGMAPGVTTVYLYVGTSNTTLLSAMASDTPLPLNLSSSWVWGPADPKADDPYFKKMAAQGQSFFQGSGDGGGFEGSALWPSNAAYVISVGGTDLTTTGPGGAWASETAWTNGGGGWGTNVPIPSWQVAAATACTNVGGECSGTYRDFPDVAANADSTFYVCADQSGCTENEDGGTSFAAPMWAGYIALANQQASAAGNPPVGFFDPIIYPLNLGNGNAYFHDITAGSNSLPCVSGFDLCDGWGSPNGAGLINALAGSGGGGAAISFTPASLKWGKVLVGQTAGQKKVTVTNTGTATLDIGNIAISGDFALATVKATKKITPCVNGTALAPSASCLLKVSFTPTQAGPRTGDVTFTDNAPNNPQNVALSGTGK